MRVISKDLVESKFQPCFLAELMKIMYRISTNIVAALLNINTMFIQVELYNPELTFKLEDRSQKKKIMFLHSKNKASRKGYKGEC